MPDSPKEDTTWTKPIEDVLASATIVTADEEDDFVDPWNVTSKNDAGVDYDKLISKHIMIYDFSTLIYKRVQNASDQLKLIALLSKS